MSAATTSGPISGSIAGSISTSIGADNSGKDRVELVLPVQGMTCAACASRIERKLNRVPGTSASVNYPLERAAVSYDPVTVGPDEILSAIESLGYSATLPAPTPSNVNLAANLAGIPDERERSLRRRLFITAPLAIVTALISMVSSLQFSRWEWVVGLTGSVAVMYGGWPFHTAAARNLRHRASSMDTLVSLGTLVATGWSWWAITQLPGKTHSASLASEMGAHTHPTDAHQLYFEAGAVVIAFLLLGRLMEGRAKSQAGEALRALASFAVRDVEVFGANGSLQTRALSSLLPGQRFMVRPGARVATDGIVIDGASSVDRSILTGESVPEDVAAGSEVIGGTLNTVGALTVRATRVGADTQLAQITQLVEHAQTEKAAVQSLADRVSAFFVPAVLALAVFTFAFWSWHDSNTTRALRAAISVLIIACPCALGLATPTALLVGTTRGAQLGLLLRGPSAIEASEKIDTLVFDKTGTLTEGRMRVVNVKPAPGVDGNDLLQHAAAAEQYSEHPIAHAIVQAARGPIPEQANFVSVPGCGVEANIAGSHIRVGKPQWATPHLAIAPTTTAAPTAPTAPTAAETTEATVSPNVPTDAPSSAATIIGVSRDANALGHIFVADRVKGSARPAVATAQVRGLRTVLLTGDAEPVARAVAHEVGIAEHNVESQALPQDKLAFIHRAQAKGHRVAMVGDGVNDAAALAAADLGIAMAAGSEVARAAADITVIGEDVHGVLHALQLARATMRTIRTNLFWAFAYNVAALPIAASGKLNPMIAGAAMSVSSVFVVANSVRLRRFKPEISRGTV